MKIPEVRGQIIEGRDLSSVTWLRVGGPADYFFMPADEDDLAQFLANLDPSVNLFTMGVGSNLIVRDGGVRGVVIRLGRGFNGISIDGDLVTAGAAALDAHVARRAAAAGVDLTFLRTIPGSIGGAVRMNAGCYGAYMADVFVSGRGVNRRGERVEFSPADLEFSYRNSALDDDVVITDVVMRGAFGDPDQLELRMKEQLEKRDLTQPTKDRTAGSTFRNPAGFSSTGREDDRHDLKAWKVIDDAGLRGARIGGAQMNEMHSNFLTNTGNATAENLENLGNYVIKKVCENSGIELEWEIKRVGEPRKK